MELRLFLPRAGQLAVHVPWICLGRRTHEGASDTRRPQRVRGRANNSREIVGWAENGVKDTESCAAPRTIQFRPVIWGPGTEEIRELPLWSATDNSGAATAINDVGQVVGISGECDQAVGRHTARHAVIWENGTVDNIGTLGGNTWNTPTAINRHGVVVGFASQAGDHPDNPRLRAFVWTRSEGIRDLGTLYRTIRRRLRWASTTRARSSARRARFRAPVTPFCTRTA